MEALQTSSPFAKRWIIPTKSMASAQALQQRWHGEEGELRLQGEWFRAEAGLVARIGGGWGRGGDWGR